jgi:hypothetical protein
MRKQSRKDYRPTSRTSQQVEVLVAAGVKKDVIARTIGCTVSELEKHHQEELDTGLEVANAKVINNVFNTAVGNSRQAMTAASLWLKNRAGWKDKQSHEHTGEDGRPIETATVELDPKAVEAIRRRYILGDEPD